ncbi:MAG: DUF1611 domain-containing protein [Cyclobacteriaceae bacterium]|nr:DUF1611 domain-containing protein [Cyclobacteriaceae bacterium]
MQTALRELTGTACIITGGLLATSHAKTAHGLLRESKRFDISGVIDDKCAGRDAGEYLAGAPIGIPVFATVEDLITSRGVKPDYAILGMATKGGVLPAHLYPVIEEVLHHGISIVNGLHQPLSEVAALKSIAERHGAVIYDIRKPKPFGELHFWSGKIMEVDAIKLGVLGTDCALGKRTTAKLLVNALNEAGISAQMIYTGQTGWLQGTKYGFIFDATPNDFIPGEVEHAIYECWLNEKPEVIVVEGQASLRNPGGPCGSEFIISGRLDGVVLQHHPTREKYSNLEYLPTLIPDPMEDVQLIKMLGTATWAMTLNTAGLTSEEKALHKTKLAADSGLTVVCPLEDGLEEIVQLIRNKLVTA